METMLTISHRIVDSPAISYNQAFMSSINVSNYNITLIKALMIITLEVLRKLVIK